MSDGLRQYAPGLQMTIRNLMLHASDELDEQPDLERLAVAGATATVRQTALASETARRREYGETHE
jgi:hypothetical protein